MAYGIFLGGKRAKAMFNGSRVAFKGSTSTRPQLTAPTISLDGDTLTMTATDSKTEEFVIFVDGVETATVVKLISFSDSKRGYQAVAGMTWGEWVASKYNTGGWYNSGDQILKVVGDIGYSLTYDNGTIVHPNDVITAQAYGYYKEPL